MLSQFRRRDEKEGTEGHESFRLAIMLIGGCFRRWLTGSSPSTTAAQAQLPSGRAERPTVDSSDSFSSLPALSFAISAMACDNV